MSDRIWICFAEAPAQPGEWPSIPAWTDKEPTANGWRADGLEMVEYLRAGAPRSRTSRWRYEIQDGAGAEFAQVFDDRGALVGTVKLHHAFMIVGSINNDEVATIYAPPIPPLLQREWMAQALFDVDALDHLEWDDASLDKRERYLCLADAAITKAALWSPSS